MSRASQWESPTGGEVLGSNRWYGLVSTQHGFSIWRIDDASDHVWQAPASEEGSEAAWDVFKSLSRQAWARHVVPRALLILTIAASVIFLGTQVALSLLTRTPDFGGERQPMLDWVRVVVSIASTLMFTAVAVLAAWFLAARLADR